MSLYWWHFLLSCPYLSQPRHELVFHITGLVNRSVTIGLPSQRASNAGFDVTIYMLLNFTAISDICRSFFQIKLHLLSTVLLSRFQSPTGALTSTEKGSNCVFHGCGGHSKRKCHRVNFPKPGAWQIVLIVNTGTVITIFTSLGSTLAQAMDCYLTAPSHCITQCWFLNSEDVWHSAETSLTVSMEANTLCNVCNDFEN